MGRRSLGGWMSNVIILSLVNNSLVPQKRQNIGVKG